MSLVLRTWVLMTSEAKGRVINSWERHSDQEIPSEEEADDWYLYPGGAATPASQLGQGSFPDQVAALPLVMGPNDKFPRPPATPVELVTQGNKRNAGTALSALFDGNRNIKALMATNTARYRGARGWPYTRKETKPS